MKIKIKNTSLKLLYFLVLFCLCGCDPGWDIKIINHTSFSFIPEYTELKTIPCAQVQNSYGYYKNYKTEPFDTVVIGDMGVLKNAMDDSYNGKFNLLIIPNDTLEKYKNSICYIFENHLYFHLTYSYDEIKTNKNTIIITDEDLNWD